MGYPLPSSLYVYRSRLHAGLGSVEQPRGHVYYASLGGGREMEDFACFSVFLCVFLRHNLIMWPRLSSNSHFYLILSVLEMVVACISNIYVQDWLNFNFKERMSLTYWHFLICLVHRLCFSRDWDPSTIFTPSSSSMTHRSPSNM